MADFDRLTPLYAQVKQRLLADIDAGVLAAGDFLPPEVDLCATFGVSRITLRRAVSELCDRGLLIRQQGRGTLVSPRPTPQTLVSLSGFTEVMEALGKSVRHVVLDHEVDPDDPRAAEALRLGPGSRLVRFLRLITVDERPMTLETLYLDAVRFPGVNTPVARGESFFKALLSAHNVSPAATERIINVGFARPEERGPLCTDSSQPVYRIDKTIFASDDTPIAWSRLVTPTTLVTYSVRS